MGRTWRAQDACARNSNPTCFRCTHMCATRVNFKASCILCDVRQLTSKMWSAACSQIHLGPRYGLLLAVGGGYATSRLPKITTAFAAVSPMHVLKRVQGLSCTVA